MHLTVLVSLLTVTVCGQTTVISQTTTSSSHFNSSLVTSTTNITLQTQNATKQVTTDVAPTSPLTPRAEEVSSSNTTLNTTTQTFSGNVSQEQMVLPTSESLNATASTTGNMTSSGLSANWGKDDLTSNPGLVAIICIFCIVLALLFVVVTVKCIRSPRSNFERLEDMPMGKVNEESPFAHYSK